ncbi:hypothetical protein Tco_0714332 [Tanacetum coccineum]
MNHNSNHFNNKKVEDEHFNDRASSFDYDIEELLKHSIIPDFDHHRNHHHHHHHPSVAAGGGMFDGVGFDRKNFAGDLPLPYTKRLNL